MSPRINGTQPSLAQLKRSQLYRAKEGRQGRGEEDTAYICVAVKERMKSQWKISGSEGNEAKFEYKD